LWTCLWVHKESPQKLERYFSFSYLLII
jgi:hypothetical protein